MRQNFDYKVFNYKTKDSWLMTEKELKDFISINFAEAGPNFCNYLFEKRLKNSRYPYTNSEYTISCVSVKTIKKSKNLDFSKKFELEGNLHLELGHKRNFNEWTIFNEKTGKTATFTNLSAVARTLNLNYSWLYSHIKNNNAFSIGNYTFSHNVTEEDKFYQMKLSEIV